MCIHNSRAAMSFSESGLALAAWPGHLPRPVSPEAARLIVPTALPALQASLYKT